MNRTYTLAELKAFIRHQAHGVAIAYGDNWDDPKTRRDCIRFYIGCFKSESATLTL
jgi:hypothetical protein